MAAGDAIGAIFKPNAASYYNFQPAAGVEICITTFVCQDPATAGVYLDNGTDQSWIQKAYNLTSYPGKVIISNTLYLQFYNGAGGPRTVGYTGIQLK